MLPTRPPLAEFELFNRLTCNGNGKDCDKINRLYQAIIQFYDIERKIKIENFAGNAGHNHTLLWWQNQNRPLCLIARILFVVEFERKDGK